MKKSELKALIQEVISESRGAYGAKLSTATGRGFWRASDARTHGIVSDIAKKLNPEYTNFVTDLENDKIPAYKRRENLGDLILKTYELGKKDAEDLINTGRKAN
jgi:hypothetical protein